MARTRAQDKAQSGHQAAALEEKKPALKETPSKKRPHSKTAAANNTKSRTTKKAKTDKSPAEDETENEPDEPKTEKPSKPAKSSKKDAVKDPKIESLISKYGELPLSETSLEDPTKASPETILALVLNAMLSSARISHDLAAKSVSCVIDAGYHKLDVLQQSSWDERTKVLTKGGYTRYREKTATAFGELAELVQDKYGKAKSIVPT